MIEYLESAGTVAIWKKIVNPMLGSKFTKIFPNNCYIWDSKLIFRENVCYKYHIDIFFSGCYNWKEGRDVTEVLDFVQDTIEMCDDGRDITEILDFVQDTIEIWDEGRDVTEVLDFV